LFGYRSRTIGGSDLPPNVERITCDHTDDRAVDALFRKIEERAGRLDILVNNAWGGYERMVEDGKFTFIAPFWQQPAWRWDALVTTDTDVIRQTGQVLVAAALAEEYGFDDI
jgi:NAD(P)-dependent dehydrogenase (short-subunit alcohol dehydrogenase family)